MKLALAAIIVITLTGCAQDMSKFSSEYQKVWAESFERNLKGGGIDAVATANLYAHTDAERKVGK